MASQHSQGGTDDSASITQLQPHTHSFIVKVWQEQERADPCSRTWRGQLTHVPSGERYYFTQLSEIPTLITPFFTDGETEVRYPTAEPDERIALMQRIWQWFHRPS